MKKEITIIEMGISFSNVQVNLTLGSLLEKFQLLSRSIRELGLGAIK